MFKQLRRRLGWKLFLSYLVVVLAGAGVLIVAMSYTAPRAFDRHLTNMEVLVAGDHDMMGSGYMVGDLFANFSTAVTEATLLALAAATIVAVAISAAISRRIVAPIREMMRASQRIAQGDYSWRVVLPRDRPAEEMDELGRLAQSFNQMTAQLEESDALRRQLIGDVTHELSAPLTVIKGSMEGLIDGILPPEPETFQQVHHEAVRLQRLVADLQELSRVEAGAYQLHLQPVDLGALTSAIANRLRRQFDDKGVSLQIHLPPGLVMAEADPDRLSQVLINLMGNALQYTPPDGQVDVTLEREHGEVTITVKDTGAGIPAEHLPHLFTRFYRVDKSRARASGGSGIGLTIARHLVEAHGGQIRAESEGKGLGSVFWFSLPILSHAPDNFSELEARKD